MASASKNDHPLASAQVLSPKAFSCSCLLTSVYEEKNVNKQRGFKSLFFTLSIDAGTGFRAQTIARIEWKWVPLSFPFLLMNLLEAFDDIPFPIL